MNETLQDKLTRLLGDEEVYRVDINYKCKTRDGMLYTMDRDTFGKREGEDHEDFGCRVMNGATGVMLHLTEEAEKTGYWYSVDEMVAINKPEVIRIWAELGDIYTNSMPEKV